ncbi:MAG: iron-sulfur cluster assembly scaffold protein [Patescibacteria group bacterium]
MSLYSDTILEYAKNPPNKGILPSATFSHHEMNRSCGDSLTVHVRLNNELVEDYAFE